jgi:hypothetical protein
MKKLNVLLFLAAMVSFTSCLKDGKVNFPEGASPMTVQWGTAALDDAPQNSASNIYRTYARTLAIGAAIPMTLMVDITGSDVAAQDITVNLTVSTAAYAAYTTKYATTNPILPASIYTMPATVTILKGTRSAAVPIVVNTASASFSLASVYMLPVQISSVSSGTVSGNYGTVIYLVNAKNAYEADYTTTGFLFHPTAGSERALSRTQHFYSSGLNTSYKEFGDLGASGYQYQFDISGSTLSNYVALGATPPAPGSGFMTADNPGGIAYTSTTNADRPGTAPWVQATYNNTYNATSKTFFLHVGYASGGNGQNTWSRQVYEKCVRAN